MMAHSYMMHILLGGGRGGGRTTAMIEAARAVKGAVFIAADHVEKKRIQRIAPDIEVIALGDLDRMRGRSPVYVLDHYALELLWGELEREHAEAMENLAKELKKKPAAPKRRRKAKA